MWHALPLKKVLEKKDASIDGLSKIEAAKRLELLGPNTLPHEPPATWWMIAFRQFQNPLIYILALAALVSIIIGHFTDAMFIAAVLAIHALIGGIQELKAEQSAKALQKLLKIRAVVERDGDAIEINADEVVPGDIVWLESGNRVPADLRLISARGLDVDESLLTGESLPVHKDADWMGKEETPMAEQSNMVHAGTIITRGRAKGLVVETGKNTEVGKLALAVIGSVGGKPPLIVRMEKFSRSIALAVLVAAVFVAILGTVFHGYSPTEMLIFGVALAVSAIPEGLPVALSVALAIGTNRMARRGVIVRRLAAVEGLGSCTEIATDKTGTLTCNELTVKEVRLLDGTVFHVSGAGFIPEGHITHQDRPVQPNQFPSLTELTECVALTNEAELHKKKDEWVWHGESTDLALLTYSRKLNIARELLLDTFPEVARIPFEPEHKFSAAYHKVDDQTKVFVKGAPERVLEMCTNIQDRKKFQEASLAMAKQGYRILGVATGVRTEPYDPEQTPPEPSNLTFLGFIGMMDPLRPGVKTAIQACHKAGVLVSMVTGDHPVTASTIAKDLGLSNGNSEVVTGTDLRGKTEKEIQEICRNTRVFARIEPDQKLLIVKTLQAMGQFVAVTGDGVNDAPALRSANVGVAMGKSGTDVAREASEIVISDDNFATIVSGLEEGRVAYDNIRKVIYLLISTGLAEVVLVTLSVALGYPLPLLPVQLLWLNLITNGIQDVSLAFEPSEGDVLERQPRSPKEPIFNRLMIERTLVGAFTMGLVGFTLFVILLKMGWEESTARNALLLLMVLFENVHIGNSRSETKSAFRLSPLRNPILLVGTLSAFSIHVLMMYIPFGQKVLQAKPVDPQTWGILICCALTVLVTMEIHKWSWSRRGS